MTDFQTSLIAAAGVFVAGVFVYNKWQEHKAKKSVERAFASEHDDVLMRKGEDPVYGADGDLAARSEPSFSLGDVSMVDGGSGAYAVPAHEEPVAPTLSPVDDDVAIAPATAPAAEADVPPAAPRQEPQLADPLATEPPIPVPPRAADAAVPRAELATALVDPLVDCLLPLELAAPMRGEKLLPALHKLRLVGSKPVHYIGLAVSGDWEPIQHGTVYTKLQGGVQLASRTTALNELEYSELVTRLRSMADEIGAEPHVPDMIEVMAEAKNLHRFVASHDAQLGVNLAANGAPWAIATLIGALEKQGFDVRPDGRFVMPDGEGGQLFTLSTNVSPAEETTPRLTLLLDVPCVAPARDGFGAMIACAKALVQRLDAVIVDDYNQPLTDAALAEIAGQVRDFYADMEASDIPAGSTRALRLFN
ncbi:cell division protein ZipA C-terminal FtsZ-binding domain-containing protein [Pseudoduganella chitinolytica]|uniref:Cell division protein ZipA n=1 Tax=Pseudoduganella chitinolytica TaxID=34070 RepID=A0ABY8BGQ7_9BURK|nr:cell division protein ZipA C-terminal FtsZ-binding domain-containing protein [Pseudoduganella chitinolytica]WEF34153.1 cell division protein ZipA C-terminal FtsZ-binding domain-containing protein [Pseudoduganella chitinolytica]